MTLFEQAFLFRITLAYCDSLAIQYNVHLQIVKLYKSIVYVYTEHIHIFQFTEKVGAITHGTYPISVRFFINFAFDGN